MSSPRRNIHNYDQEYIEVFERAGKGEVIRIEKATTADAKRARFYLYKVREALIETPHAYPRAALLCHKVKMSIEGNALIVSPRETPHREIKDAMSHEPHDARNHAAGAEE